MKPSQKRSLWQMALAFASLSLSFAACGGLDGRRVTRGPDEPVGGDAAGGKGGGSSGTNAVGGAEGGQPPIDNPFGGETFTGGAPPVLDGPPEVLEVSPADAEVNVEPDGSMALRFSEGLDEATVTSDNIQLLDGDEPVEGELEYSGVVSTFTPARRLSLLATYDVSVTTAVTDGAGNPLEATFASSFTVREGAWTAQRSIFTDSTIDSGRQDVASDGLGNTLFVWTTRTDETGNNPTVAYARWNNLETGLAAPVKLDDCTDNCSNVRVAVSPEGDAVVAWTNNAYLVRARRYVSGAWESRAQTLWTTPSNNPVQPAVAIGGGQVVVAWAHHQITPSNYYLIEMSATTLEGQWPTMPWSNYSVGYSAPNYESIGGVTAAVDAQGAALVAFTHNSSSTAASTPKGVYYASKPPAGDWEYPVKIASSNTVAGSPILASDGDGAMAIWNATLGNGGASVVASRFTKAKQFVAPVPISDPDLTGYVALGSSYALAGNSTAYFATWAQVVGTFTKTFATRFDVSTGKWNELPTIVSDNAGDNRAIGIDAHGNAILAFDQEGPTKSLVMAARYVASTGRWGAPDPLTVDANDFGFPTLTVAPNGTASLFYGPTYRDGPLRGPAPRGSYRLFK
ncbi:MAG: repeat-containing protein [Polyangiaceae bacterium]|nr:repeat-containing protein [Polyangiaceae bacterium]